MTIISHMKDRSPKIIMIMIDRDEDDREASEEYFVHNATINQQEHTIAPRCRLRTNNIPKKVATPFPPRKNKNNEKR